MVVADEVKVAVDNGKYGFVRVRSEKSGVRWAMFRRAAIPYITFSYPPAVAKTRTAFESVLELTHQAVPSSGRTPIVGDRCT